MSEQVLTCALATCGAKFIPTLGQLGQRRRGRKSYCSPECCLEAARIQSRNFWRSERGRRYRIDRYHAARKAAGLKSIRTK